MPDWRPCYSKTFAVPVEPVKKPSSVVTSDQPFFYPGTSTSGLSSGVTVGGAGPSLAQTTGEAAFVSEAASECATRPGDGPGVMVNLPPIKYSPPGEDFLENITPGGIFSRKYYPPPENFPPHLRTLILNC